MNTPRLAPLASSDGSEEVPDLALADAVVVRVALSLDVDVGEAESVLTDNAIDSAVVGITHMNLMAFDTTVTRGPQELKHGFFKELR